MSQNFNSLQDRNKQTLNSISQLQKQEKLLYDSLNDVSLSTQQKKINVNKINELSQMRMNMYENIKDLNSHYQKDLTTSKTTLGQQLLAIDILENELNDAKKRMNLLEQQKYDKLRLIEINTYYGKRYNAYSNLMKTIVITLIPVIILSVLANKGFLPPKLYVFITGIVLIIGVYFIGMQIIDISNRDNMNWDEYNWYFDKSQAPSDKTEGAYDDPWKFPSLTCVGSACCYEGSTYDEDLNICVPNK